MKARSDNPAAKECDHGSGSEQAAPPCASEEMDFSLLEDSLAKTPWERMQANDDALHLADLLRAAMEKRNAKAQ